MRTLKWLLACAIIGGAMLSSVSTQANTLLPGEPTVTTVSPGLFQWSYDIFLDGGTTGSQIKPDATNPPIFTFYDITGYVAGSEGVTPSAGTAKWTASEQLLGVTPIGISPFPPDDPNLLNVTITYTGTDTISVAANARQQVATLTFESRNNVIGTSNLQYAGHDFDHAGTYQRNGGYIEGPAVPEPAFYQLSALLGLGGFGLLRLRRKA